MLIFRRLALDAGHRNRFLLKFHLMTTTTPSTGGARRFSSTPCHRWTQWAPLGTPVVIHLLVTGVVLGEAIKGHGIFIPFPHVFLTRTGGLLVTRLNHQIPFPLVVGLLILL